MIENNSFSREKNKIKDKLFLFVTLMIISLVQSYFPHFVGAQNFPEVVCAITEEIYQEFEMNTYIGSSQVKVQVDLKNIALSCRDEESGEEFTITFDVVDAEEPFMPVPEETETLLPSGQKISVRQEEFKRTFNCHTYVLQVWQERFHFNVGIDENTALNNKGAMKEFMEHFGTPIYSESLASFDEQNPAIEEGDAVLFLHVGEVEGEKIEFVYHSAIAYKDPITNEIKVEGKDSNGPMIEGGILATAEYYQLQQETGDYIAVYRYAGGIQSVEES